MVAARLATLSHGGDRKSPIGDLKQSEAASMLNVGKRSVERAREVLEDGAPELVATVDQGRVSVSAAADVATLPMAEQSQIVARGERAMVAARLATMARGANQHAQICAPSQSDAADMLQVSRRTVQSARDQ